MSLWKYVLLWVLSFAFTSAIDALWHLGIFGKIYGRDFRPLARMTGEKITFHAPTGLLAQVLVVTAIFFLVLFKMPRWTSSEAMVVGAVAGVLAITVYGLTNYSLFKDWSMTLTMLEVVWGPVLGGLSGLFIFWMKNLLNR